MVFLHRYLDKKVRAMERVGFEIYPALAVLLNYSMQFRLRHIYNEHSLVRLLHVEFNLDDIPVHGVQEHERMINKTYSETGEMELFKNGNCAYDGLKQSLEEDRSSA